jgi:butyryl-CoA dehydrogenase
LNIGRFKLGAGVVGGARNALLNAMRYAKDRKAFGKSLTEFGMIKEKLANMIVGTYVGECLAYRTIGMIEAALAEVDKNAPNASEQIRKGIEEYAVECSILKVWGSEMIDRVVDETVQIYGGYGFVEEYPAERAFRDARVNRIFEGTNEINRMIITGWLMKRAMKGELALMPAIKQLMDEIFSGPSTVEPFEGVLANERTMLANAKKAGLLAAGVATQKYMQALADQQEVMGAIADMVIEGYAMESAILRARKIAENKGEAAAAHAIAMAQVYAAHAMERIEAAARKVLAACAEGDMLRTQMTIMRRLFKYAPINTIELRRQIADKVLEAGKYVV